MATGEPQRKGTEWIRQAGKRNGTELNRCDAMCKSMARQSWLGPDAMRR